MSETNNTPNSIDDGIPEVDFTLQVANVVQAPIDPTLSIEGMAADAKATGDAIAETETELQETISTTAATLQASITQVDTTLQASIASTKQELQDEIDAIETGVDSVAGRLFPVGCIYVSASATAPTFGGATWVWEEIMIPATWGDLEDGTRSFRAKEAGDTPGTLHLWRRTA
jgi:hypothetical protein